MSTSSDLLDLLLQEDSRSGTGSAASGSGSSGTRSSGSGSGSNGCSSSGTSGTSQYTKHEWGFDYITWKKVIVVKCNVRLFSILFFCTKNNFAMKIAYN